MKILTLSTVLSGLVIGILIIPIAGTLVGLFNFWNSKEFEKFEGETWTFQIENKVTLPGTSLKLLKKTSSDANQVSSYELEFEHLKVSPKTTGTESSLVDIHHVSTLTGEPESVFEIDHTKLKNEGNLLIRIKDKYTLNYVLFGFTLVTLIIIGIYGFGLFLLSRLYKNVARSDIFSKSNQHILIKLAFITFGIFLWNMSFDSYIRSLIMDSFFPKGGYYNYDISFDLGGLLAGSILLLMAGITSKGREIKEEQDLTI